MSKLLIDNNLSWRLAPLLRGEFAAVAHVSEFGMREASDEKIHAFALADGWIVVTKDDDFVAIALTDGSPTKVILLRIGNGPKTVARDVLLQRKVDVEGFAEDPERRVMILSG